MRLSKSNWVPTVAALLLVAGWAGCGSSLPYKPDYPLTDQPVRARDGIIRGMIPAGWFSPTDDTLPEGTIALLVRDDFAASITLRELILDGRSASHIDKEGLGVLALLSARLHEAGGRQSLSGEPGKFEMSGKLYSGYELVSAGGRARVVVFRARGRHYECEARSTGGTWTPEEFKHLFTVQQSFLSSLVY